MVPGGTEILPDRALPAFEARFFGAGSHRLCLDGTIIFPAVESTCQPFKIFKENIDVFTNNHGWIERNFYGSSVHSISFVSFEITKCI